jgi:hypothetical protein
MGPILFALSWDPTITAGNLLTAVMMLGGVFVAYVGLRERLIAIETRLGPVWTDFIERRSAARRLEDRE